MPKCLLLFGSVARGTETESSDVDLLAVGGDVTASSMKVNGVEVQNYTEEKFFLLATTGDLFGAHLAVEARVIFDPSHLFNRFREVFKLRSDYGQEISHACDLATYLYTNGGNYKNQELVAKRLAWCVRTVLIAKLAEERKTVFSPEGLYRDFPYSWASHLIGLRRGGANSIERKEILNFLHHFDQTLLPPANENWEEHFERTGNQVAQATVRQLSRSAAAMKYTSF